MIVSIVIVIVIVVTHNHNHNNNNNVEPGDALALYRVLQGVHHEEHDDLCCVLWFIGC